MSLKQYTISCSDVSFLPQSTSEDVNIFFDDGFIQCKTDRHYDHFSVLKFCLMFLADSPVLMSHYVHNLLMMNMIVKNSFVANIIDIT